MNPLKIESTNMEMRNKSSLPITDSTAELTYTDVSQTTSEAIVADSLCNENNIKEPIMTTIKTEKTDIEKEDEFILPDSALELPNTDISSNASDIIKPEITSDDETDVSNSFECKLCNCMFKNRSLFTKHLCKRSLRQRPSVKYCSQRKAMMDKKIANWKSDLECPLCYATASNLSLLKVHFQQEHPDDECHVVCCDRKLKTRSELETHLDSHQKKAFKNDEFIAKVIGELECPLCQATFPKFAQLNFHFKDDHPGKKCYMLCCTKKFWERPHIVKHIQENHIEPDNFQCEICKRIFNSSVILDHHVTREHALNCDSDLGLANTDVSTNASDFSKPEITSDEPHMNSGFDLMATQFENVSDGPHPFQCNICDRSFKKRRFFKLHSCEQTLSKRSSTIASLVPENGAVRCKVCGKRFETLKSCTHHFIVMHLKAQRKKEESNPRNVKFDKIIAKHKSELDCPLCYATVPNFFSLKVHFWQRHSDDKCHIICCDKKFMSRFEVAEHLKSHGSSLTLKKNLEFIAKEKTELECTLCQKVFPQYSQLKCHFGYDHPGEKCHILCCNQKLIGPQVIVDHLKTHVKQKDFQCQICEKMFLSRVNLHRHVKKKHTLNCDQFQNLDTPISTNGLDFINNDETHMNSGFDLMAHQFESKNESERTLRQRGSVKYCSQSRAMADKIIAEWKSELECQLCHATTPNFSLLKVHFKQEHPDDECHVVCCDRKIKKRPELVLHIKRHGMNSLKNYDEFLAKGDGELECPLCQATFPKFSQLTFHFKEDHPGKKCHVLCCGKKITNRQFLLKHIQNHTKRNGFQCKICKRLFSSRAILNQHVKRKHTLNCDQFQISFVPSTQHQQIKIKHQSRKTKYEEILSKWKTEWECPLCQAKVSDFYLLEAHFEDEHPHDQCHILCCYRKLMNPRQIVNHINNHKNKSTRGRYENEYLMTKWKNEWECPLCKSIFSYFNLLKNHFEDEHPDDKCHIVCCNKKLQKRYEIVRHLKGHEEKKGKTKWDCPLCQAYFSNFDLLKKHFKDEHPSDECHIVCCNTKLTTHTQIWNHHIRCHENRLQKMKNDNVLSKWKSEWECPLCKATQASYNLLKLHFSDEHPQEKCHIVCCNTKLSYRRQIIVHINGHKNEKTIRRIENDDLLAKWTSEWECRLCKSIFINFDLLKTHFKYEHPGDKCLVVCCNKNLNRFQLVNHIKTIHHEPTTRMQNEEFILKWYGDLECPVCRATFSNYTPLENHFIEDHPDIPCHVMCCKLSLYSQADIVDHLKLHMTNTLHNSGGETRIAINHNMQNVDDQEESYIKIDDEVIFNPTLGTIEPLNKQQTPIHYKVIELATDSNTIAINSNRTKPTEINDLPPNINEDIKSYVKTENEVIWNPTVDTIEPLNKQQPQIHFNAIEFATHSNSTVIKSNTDGTELTHNDNNSCVKIKNEIDLSPPNNQTIQRTETNDFTPNEDNKTYVKIENEVILNPTMDTIEPLNKQQPQIHCDAIEFATHSKSIVIASNTDRTKPTENIYLTHNVNKDNNSYIKIKNVTNLSPPNTDTVGVQFNKQIYQIAARSKSIQRSKIMKPGTKLKALKNDNFIAKWNGDLECPLCGNLFKNYGSLQIHFWNQHPNEKCHVLCCKRKLFFPCHIVDHIIYHTNPKAFTCVKCGDLFTGSEYLKRHLRKRHSMDLEQANLIVNEIINTDCVPQKDGTRIMDTINNSTNTNTDQSQITMLHYNSISDNNFTNTDTNQSHNTMTHYDLSSDNTAIIEESNEQDKTNSLEPHVKFVDKVIASSSCNLSEQMGTTDKQQSIEIKKEIYGQNEANFIMETEEEKSLTHKMAANVDNNFMINVGNKQTSSSYFQTKECEEIVNPTTTGNLKQSVVHGDNLQQEDNQIANDYNLTTVFSIVANSNDELETASKAFKLECPICKEPFKKYQLLRSHFRAQHPSEKFHIICCKTKLEILNRIIDHLNKFHKVRNEFKCEICNVFISGLIHLKMHIGLEHAYIFEACCNINEFILNGICNAKTICRTNLMETHVVKIHDEFILNQEMANIGNEQSFVEIEKHEEILNPLTMVTKENHMTDITEIDTSLMATNINESFDKSSNIVNLNATDIKLNNKRKSIETSTQINKIVCYDLTDEDVNNELITNGKVTKVNLTTHTDNEIEEKVILRSIITVDTVEKAIEQNQISIDVPHQDNKEIAFALNKLDSDEFLNKWNGKFQCTSCQNSFAKYSLLNSHFIAEHPTEKCHIICCRLKLVSTTAIVNHIQFHINRQVYECQICFTTFNNVHNLNMHIQELHAHLIDEDDGHSNSTESYIKTIEQKLDKKDIAAANDKIIAQLKGNLECPLCQDSLVDFCALKKHFDINHPSKKCFTTCCSIKLVSRFQIAKHLQTHINPKANECNSLISHMNVMHHVCKHCPMKFKTIGNLTRHIQNKHLGDGNTELCNEISVDESQITFEIIQLPEEANVETKNFGVNLQQNELHEEEEEEFQNTMSEQSSSGTKVKQEADTNLLPAAADEV